MKEIEIIIYIISLLFILERKAINNIIYFILLIINISIYIYMTLNYSYLTFILIIVYSTAIIILFSFIIMLPQTSNNLSLYINPLFLSLLLIFPFLYFFTYNIPNNEGSTFPILIGEYLYNNITGNYYIFLILLLLFLPIPGIYYILKSKVYA